MNQDRGSNLAGSDRLGPWPGPPSTVADAFAATRSAQQGWASTPLRRRLAVVRGVRHRLADRSLELASLLELPWRNGLDESLSAEVLPLSDACRMLERSSGRLLRPRRVGAWGRPIWLAGCVSRVYREPRGVVLVIAPSNYPLLLAAVPMLQALAAGNAVVVKPGRGSELAVRRLAGWIVEAGAPSDVCQVIDSGDDAARQAVASRPDFVVFTGSLGTGRSVLAELAKDVTPSTMELSGADAVFVAPDADLDRVADHLAFGLRFNSSATCLAPRRVFCTLAQQAQLVDRLAARLDRIDAGAVAAGAARRAVELVRRELAEGARLVIGDPEPESGEVVWPIVLADVEGRSELARSDLFAPVTSLVPVVDMDEALALDAACPYALGATIFTRDARVARSLAGRVDAGSVTVNDLIAPTADPRLPFGGRRASGFGVTRGPEGLLELTQVKVVTTRRWGVAPQLQPPLAHQAERLAGLIRMRHARGLLGRLGGLATLAGFGLERRAGAAGSPEASTAARRASRSSDRTRADRSPDDSEGVI